MDITKNGKGQMLYKKAKTLIPGGTQLLSKRPEMCKIWDLDGNEYIDVSYMGIGANVLGYANDEVEEAAREAIACGGMTTLNAPEEVYLAEKLISLHPWAGGVRYAKAGGEAMALASRIARAYTKKDNILFCGYHETGMRWMTCTFPDSSLWAFRPALRGQTCLSITIISVNSTP